MISQKMQQLTQNNSVIRAMFEEGRQMAAQYGAENVYDFSLGNPSVAPPAAVEQAIRDILREEPPLLVHGYMSNAGYEDVRQAIAASLNRRFGTRYSAHELLMTVGAAAGLNILLKVLLNPGDEVIVFAPYFVEYRNYIANYDGVTVVIPPDRASFQPDPQALAAAITPRTRAVIIDSPNNPTGVIYSAETLAALAGVLRAKSREFGQPIYLLSDEPYRELAYDGTVVPWVPDFYENTAVCYSWSKSLSLPGERIGYLVLPDAMADAGLIQQAAAIAGRVLGFVNAPSLMQRVVARCVDEPAPVAVYAGNRTLLYEGLSALGYHCVFPAGAFYLWMETPGNEAQFVARAKSHHLLLVPGSSFACPGYVRIAYCVSPETIRRALPAFRALAEEVGL